MGLFRAMRSIRINRFMGVLLTGILVFHAGWYMLLPYFAVLFTTRRSLSPAQVGLVLATQSVSLLLGSLAGGMISDRTGYTPTILGGLAVRAVGLGLLGVVTGLPALMGAAVVSGFGGGLYGPSAKAAIATLAEGENRAEAFSLRGVAANIGTSTGPLLGTLLVRGSMAVLFAAAAALHLALGLFTWVSLRGMAPVRESAPAVPGRAGWRIVLADRPYLRFSLVTVLAWALFTQLALAMPLYARQMLGLEASIGLLWTMSSVAVILLQFPITRTILAKMQPLRAMAVGGALLGGGLAAIGLARSFTGLLAAVLLFVVGEMFLLPTADSTVSLLANPAAVGTYFGVSSFTWGLGEGLGNLLGGALMQVALQGGRPALPWPLYGAAGLLLAGLYWSLNRTPEMARRMEAPAAAEVPGEGSTYVYRPEASTPTPSDQVELGPPGSEEEPPELLL